MTCDFEDPRLPDRFWSKVAPCPMSGCWLWNGSLATNGYGAFVTDGKTKRAHRHAYEVLVSEIPSAKEIDHLCRIRCCVNPWHLEPVTRRMNVHRGLRSRIGWKSTDMIPITLDDWDEIQ